MDALIGIYGVVHTFGTKIIIKKKKKIWDAWQKVSSQLKSNFEFKG